MKLHSGIEVLDESITPICEPGKLLLVGGATGAGKSVLTAQILANRIWQGTETLLISNEADPREYQLRMLSNLGNVPFGKIKDGIKTDNDGHALASLYGERFRLLRFVFNMRAPRFADFAEIGKTRDHPSDLREIVTKSLAKGYCPTVVLYDWLTDLYPHFESLDSRHMQERMLEACKAFKELAETHGFFGIVTCQLDSSHQTTLHVDRSAVAECKALTDVADGFLGMGRTLRNPLEAFEGYRPDFDGPQTPPYAEEQCFSLYLEGKTQKRFYAHANFAFQRFEVNRQLPAGLGARAGAVNGVAQPLDLSVGRAARRGYLPMSRECLSELFALPNPNCVNVYVFVALAARYKPGALQGSSYFPMEKIAEGIGVTPKMARAAMEQLEESTLIRRLGTIGRAAHRSVEKWSEWHDAAVVTNYVKIHRNIQDASRRPLFRNPELLRMWLYLLSHARAFSVGDGIERVGTLDAQRSDIAEMLRISLDKVDASVSQLVERGSIVQNECQIEITNWQFYNNPTIQRPVDHNLVAEINEDY